MFLKLKLVAIVCIFVGVVNAIGTIHSFSHNHLIVNFGVVLLPLGISLLQFNQLARRLTMIYAWIEIIVSVAFILLFLTPSSIKITFTLMGLPMLKLSPVLGILSCLVSVVVAYWKYNVLSNEQVRRLFDRGFEENN